MSKSVIDKARKQLSIWVTTDTLINKMSRQEELPKVEIVHLAIAEMAKRLLPACEQEPNDE